MSDRQPVPFTRVKEIALSQGKEPNIGEGIAMAQEVVRCRVRSLDSGSVQIDLAQSRRYLARVAVALGIEVDVERYSAAGDRSRDGFPLESRCVAEIAKLRSAEVVLEPMATHDTGPTETILIAAAPVAPPPLFTFTDAELESLACLVRDNMRVPMRHDALDGFRALRRLVGQ